MYCSPPSSTRKTQKNGTKKGIRSGEGDEGDDELSKNVIFIYFDLNILICNIRCAPTRRGEREGYMQMRSRARPCNDNNIIPPAPTRTHGARISASCLQPNPNSLFSFPSYTRGITMTHEDPVRVGRRGRQGSTRVQTPHSKNIHRARTSPLLIPRFKVPRPSTPNDKRQGPKEEEKKGKRKEKLYRGISSHPLSTWRLSESERLKSFRQNRHLCSTGDVAWTVS